MMMAAIRHITGKAGVAAVHLQNDPDLLAATTMIIIIQINKIMIINNAAAVVSAKCRKRRRMTPTLTIHFLVSLIPLLWTKLSNLPFRRMVMSWGRRKNGVGSLALVITHSPLICRYDSWLRCLLTEDRKNICPLTKMPLSKRELVVLTHENIDEYR